MKTRHLILMSSLLCLSHSAVFAASDAFCERYAQKGVAQNIRNIVNECNFSGLRWSVNFIDQKRWCKTVRESIANNETTVRQNKLISCGVTPDAPINWSSVPFMLTYDAIPGIIVRRAEANDVGSMKVFKREGFSLSTDWFGNYGTALFHAIGKQAEQSVRYLINFDNPNRTSNAGPNPLANLLRNDQVNYRLLHFLLQNGSNANSSGENRSDSNIPLTLAVKNKDLRAVKELLHVGNADPNFYADTPALMTALKNKDRNIALQLIYKGAKVNDNGSGCHSPLPLDLALSMDDGALIYTIRRRGGKTAAQCRADGGS